MLRISSWDGADSTKRHAVLDWAGFGALGASVVDVSCATDLKVSAQTRSDVWHATRGNAKLTNYLTENPSYDPSEEATGIVVLGVTDEQI